MSTDYYLVSPSCGYAVNVGSEGLSGTQSYPGCQEAIDFVRWAIENNVKDIVFVNEHVLGNLEEEAGQEFACSINSDDEALK